MGVYVSRLQMMKYMKQQQQQQQENESCVYEIIANSLCTSLLTHTLARPHDVDDDG